MEFDPKAFVVVPVGKLQTFLREEIQSAVQSAVNQVLSNIGHEQEFYNAKQAAQLLGVSPAMIKKTLAGQRQKFGGATLYRRADLLALISPATANKINEKPEIKPSLRTNNTIRKNANKGLQRMTDRILQESHNEL